MVCLNVHIKKIASPRQARDEHETTTQTGGLLFVFLSVAESDTPAGPFTVTHENVTMPGPGEIGDFDIFIGAIIQFIAALKIIM